MAPEKKISGETTRTTSEKNEKNASNTKVETLVNELESLKRALDVKEKIINDLTLDRDQFKEDRDAQDVILKCTQQQLADATKRIKEPETERTNLKKETEDLRRKYDSSLTQHADALRRIDHLENESVSLREKIRNNAVTQCEDSTDIRYNEDNPETCAKEENNKKQNDNFTRNNDATNLCKDTKSIDSGIDLSSLTKLIDDRVDVKLRGRGEPLSKSNSENDCN